MGLRMTEKPANQKSQTQFFPEEEGGASKLLPTEVPFQLSLQSSHSGEVVCFSDCLRDLRSILYRAPLTPFNWSGERDVSGRDQGVPERLVGYEDCVSRNGDLSGVECGTRVRLRAQ